MGLGRVEMLGRVVYLREKVSRSHEIEDKGRGLLRVSWEVCLSSSRLLLNYTTTILMCGSGIWSEFNWTILLLHVV